VGKRSPQQLDSITGIQSLVKGGDNDICIHVINVDSTFKGLSVVFEALLDTTQHFKPSGKYPQKKQETVETAASEPVAAGKDTLQGKAGGATALADKNASAAASEKTGPGAPPKQTSGAVSYKNGKDVTRAILEYQKKTELAESDIKKERIEVQKLRIKNDDLDEQIRKVNDEIALLKKSLDEMHKGK
jgi:hypothetical protein